MDAGVAEPLFESVWRGGFASSVVVRLWRSFRLGLAFGRHAVCIDGERSLCDACSVVADEQPSFEQLPSFADAVEGATAAAAVPVELREYSTAG